MRRNFRYLVAFKDGDGQLNVAEFDIYDEYMSFKENLDKEGFWHKLINEKEFRSPTYQQAGYIDMRGA